VSVTGTANFAVVASSAGPGDRLAPPMNFARQFSRCLWRVLRDAATKTAAPCILGIVGSSSAQAAAPSVGGGMRPLRDRPRRGGERSLWHPAISACGELRGVAAAAARLATSTAWTMEYSWCPGGRRLQKPLSLFLRWAPRPRRPCRGVPKANEPAFARSVDDGSGSGDPGTHSSGGKQR
jgi:hypothetical protein